MPYSSVRGSHWNCSLQNQLQLNCAPGISVLCCVWETSGGLCCRSSWMIVNGESSNVLVFKREKRKCIVSGYEISLGCKILWFWFRMQNCHGADKMFYACVAVCPCFFPIYMRGPIHVGTYKYMIPLTMNLKLLRTNIHLLCLLILEIKKKVVFSTSFIRKNILKYLFKMVLVLWGKWLIYYLKL